MSRIPALEQAGKKLKDFTVHNKIDIDPICLCQNALTSDTSFYASRLLARGLVKQGSGTYLFSHSEVDIGLKSATIISDDGLIV